ncbi:YicC/YloC family endoribonuclease [Bartonella sp. LJL80]
MTGFARASINTEHADIVWEARSVNGKNLDIRLRSTMGLEAIESDLKKRVAAVFARGSIGLSLTVTFQNGNNGLVVNRDYLESLISLARDLEDNYGLAKPSIDGLLALKGVVEHSTTSNETIMDDVLKQAVFRSFDQVIEELALARKAEGANLHAILLSQLDEISVLTSNARNDPSRSLESVCERLKQSVEALLDANSTLDPQRLHMEAVLLATKADIQEELDRLDGHIKAARSLLDAGEPVGRRLDFLAQEFNREANTLCSKAHASSLSTTGLALKAVIDQWREQIQNIE